MEEPQGRSPGSPGADRVGLCRGCRFGETVVSARGGEFWRCRRADDDPAFTKYPRLPVVECGGYEPRQA